MPRPPFVLSPVFSRRRSWLYLAGEDELQDRHGERYHAYADDRPPAVRRCASPARINDTHHNAPSDARATDQAHARRIVCPATGVPASPML